MRALLDTYILLWWTNGDARLSPAQRQILDRATEDEPLWVSDISLWEIATLASLKRIELRTSPKVPRTFRKQADGSASLLISAKSRGFPGSKPAASPGLLISAKVPRLSRKQADCLTQ